MTRVVVVGGGVIGASIAWRLSRAGANVHLLDDGPREGAATPAAGGMLAPLAESPRPGPFLELGLESLRLYADFVAALEGETGRAVGYARAGKLVAALSAGEADELAGLHAWKASAPGTHVEWLDGAAARALEPSLAAAVRAAVLIREDHRVDSAALGAALLHAAASAGTTVRRERARRLLSRGARATGVETDGGAIVEADFVVLAAGAWSGGLDGLPRPLPVRPVRGQMLALRPARPLFGRTLASASGYLVPRPDGRVVIGSTMEEAGFAVATTPDGLAALRAGAIRLVPELADAARVGAWAGLRPATPDGLPILGRDPAMEGLIHATGHFRNGILLAPVTAEAIGALVLGGAEPALAAFSPARFDGEATGTMEAARTVVAEDPVERGVEAEPDRQCDLCGAAMYEIHCKLICPACGYKRDCTDLW